MQIRARSLLLVLAPAISIHAPALRAAPDTWVDEFHEPEGNIGAWTFNVTNPDVIEADGGDPGAWLHNDFVASFAPILTTTYGVRSPFTGNYIEEQVTLIEISAQTLEVSIPVSGRQMSILLRNTRGTPEVIDDDDYVYFVGDPIPEPGQGWVRYEFPIPSGSTERLPAGWRGGSVDDLENLRDGVTWQDVIASVDRVEFWWIDPALFSILPFWNVGVDTIAVTWGEPAPPGPRIRHGDCNSDAAVDIADGICLLGLLFLGSEQALPCGDRTLGAPENRALLDLNDDGSVGIADPIFLFGFLFLGGPPPAAGTDCAERSGCEPVCAS